MPTVYVIGGSIEISSVAGGAAATVPIWSSTDQYIVGIPQNAGAFFDGTRYWLFYQDSGSLLCKFGTDLSSLVQTGGCLVTDINNAGRAYSILFGKVGADWYAWACVNRGDLNQTDALHAQSGDLYRWKLQSSGLGTVSSLTSEFTERPNGHVRLAHDYGGSTVSQLYRVVQEYGAVIGNSEAMERYCAADLSGDAGLGAWDPASLNFPEHTVALKLSDGFYTLALDQGDSGSNTRGAYERTKTNIGDAWGAESAELGFTNQSYASGVSHAGQQDICQLDDGTIYVAYIDDTAADYGALLLKKRGNAKASSWSTISSDVTGGNVAQVCLSTDGTDVWVIYVKHTGAAVGDAIYYRKYDVSGPSWGGETSLASVSDTFNRMTTQWRADNGKAVVLWSEEVSSIYNMYAATIDM